MPAPAIPFSPMRSAPQTVEPSVGTGAGQLIPLVPLSEPIAAAAPPVKPNFIQVIDPGWAEPRRVTSVSGHVKTSAVLGEPRPRVRVEWTGLSFAERQAMWEWIYDADVGLAGGTFRAFVVELDGVDGGGEAKVRMLAPPTETHKFRKAGTAGVYAITGECEEIV